MTPKDNQKSFFVVLVTQAMEHRGLSLRALCRMVNLDPSFFSKVLSGKRSPPAEEDVLKNIARVLEIDPARIILSAGRVPEAWQSLWAEPGFLRDFNSWAAKAGVDVLPAQVSPMPETRRKENGKNRTTVVQALPKMPALAPQPRPLGKSREMAEELL